MKDPQVFAFLTQLAVSWALLSLIWIVQLVHYPSFQFIDANRFISFQHFHMQSITYVVAPLMFLELGVTIWLCYQHQFGWVYANELLLERFISTFGINPKLSKIKLIRDKIRSLGKIAA
jgi:hypothetical protein